jgi:hypothetical protein
LRHAEISSLLNEQVAKAAGFSDAARTEITSIETTYEAISVANEQVAQAAGVGTPTED